MTVHNPFLIYGYVSPTYFCDREQETKQLISALHNGRNVTLMSPRRMGKTGLIHNAFYRINEGDPKVYCFYLDIYATQSLADFVKLFGETVLGQMDSLALKVKSLASSLLTHCKISYTSDQLLGHGKITLEFAKEDADATLQDIFHYLGQADKECYIAIDEFQQIAEYKETNVEALLRTYVQQYPMLLFIFSGSKSHMMSAMIDSPKRPFYRSTEKMHLHAISQEAYRQFATNHFMPQTVLPADVFDFIYTSFCGHTWYVQYALNKIFEQAPTVVNRELVQQCILDIVRNNTEDYQKQFRMLTANQQQLLKAIAKEGNVPAINASSFINQYSLKGSSSINKALGFLTDNEFVYLYDEGYQVYDRFMTLWLRML